MVITLLTTLSLLVGTTYSWLNQYAVQAEVDNLYSTCRYLQRCALITGKEQELVFDVVQGSFTYHNREYHLPKQVSFGVLPEVKGPPSTPTLPIQHAITFVQDRIVFHPDGIIGSGTVYLVDAAKRYLYAITSPVSSVSYLRKYRYVQNKWQLIG